MKSSILTIFTIILFISCSSSKKTQYKKIGFTVTDSFKSSRYKTPSSIKFILIGKSEHDEYLKDLEKKIFQTFSHTNIELSFKYSNIAYNKNHQEKDEFLCYLKIANVKSIPVDNGVNKRLDFNLKGFLQEDENSESIFFFNSKVSALNDITSQSNEVVKYLFNKLIFN